MRSYIIKICRSLLSIQGSWILLLHHYCPLWFLFCRHPSIKQHVQPSAFGYLFRKELIFSSFEQAARWGLLLLPALITNPPKFQLEKLLLAACGSPDSMLERSPEVRFQGQWGGAGGIRLGGLEGGGSFGCVGRGTPKYQRHVNSLPNGTEPISHWPL